jgi:hypothetical protein
VIVPSTTTFAGGGLAESEPAVVVVVGFGLEIFEAGEDVDVVSPLGPVVGDVSRSASEVEVELGEVRGGCRVERDPSLVPSIDSSSSVGTLL